MSISPDIQYYSVILVIWSSPINHETNLLIW